MPNYLPHACILSFPVQRRHLREFPTQSRTPHPHEVFRSQTFLAERNQPVLGDAQQPGQPVLQKLCRLTEKAGCQACRNELPRRNPASPSECNLDLPPQHAALQVCDEARPLMSQHKTEACANRCGPLVRRSLSGIPTHQIGISAMHAVGQEIGGTAESSVATGGA